MSFEASHPYPRPRGLNTHPNQPASFTSGLLAGLTVRIEIEETQKADLGRKYARKDKRPLDPPPVVICSYSNLTSGAHSFREQPLPIETASLGAVCHVDLFPVPPDYEDYVSAKAPASFTQALPPMSLQLRAPDAIFSSANAGPSSLPPPSAIMQGLLPPMSMPPPRDIDDGTLTSTNYFAPFHPSTFGRYPQTPSSLYSTPMLATHGQGAMLPGVQSLAAIGRLTDDGRQMQARGLHPSDVVAWFGSHPIRESDKCSTMLAGATFVQAEIVDYNGKKEAMFVFSDLAVKVEGTFVLRYRTMNLTSQIGSSRPFRVLAECFGGPFKVYSTKEFPGLPPSTPLTKLLSMYGIRVNMRENERKRRTKSEIDADAELDDAPSAPTRRGAGLEIVPTVAAGPSSPTRMAQYSPMSATSVASSAASGSYSRTRARGFSRGSGHSMRSGMDVDERSEDY